MAKRSAGLLVWRRTRTPDLQVLLGHPGGPLHARRDVWGLPKGEYDGDEAPLEAARREFTEETGLPAPEGEPVPLGEVRQRSGKVVTAWAVEADLDLDGFDPGTFTMEWPPRSGRRQAFPEIDRIAWFPLAEARAKVSQAQEAFLDRLEALG